MTETLLELSIYSPFFAGVLFVLAGVLTLAREMK